MCPDSFSSFDIGLLWDYGGFITVEFSQVAPQSHKWGKVPSFPLRPAGNCLRTSFQCDVLVSCGSCSFHVLDKLSL